MQTTMFFKNDQTAITPGLTRSLAKGETAHFHWNKSGYNLKSIESLGFDGEELHLHVSSHSDGPWPVKGTLVILKLQQEIEIVPGLKLTLMHSAKPRVKFSADRDLVTFSFVSPIKMSPF